MEEALACGTPGVARRRASVLEVIADGLTGLIGETDGELAELCSMVGSLNRAACRAEAERRFSAWSMADGYEVVYRRLLRPNAAEGASRECRAREYEYPLRVS